MNVREIMKNEEVVKKETMVAEKKPSMGDAYERLNSLKNMLNLLSAKVNATSVDNTEESWHRAYEKLTTAFKNCMNEEKKIIVKS